MSPPVANTSPARSRAACGICALIVIGVGLASRRFPFLFPPFLGKYPGDSLWAMVVYLGWAVLLPKASIARLAVLALGSTWTIEFLKLCPLAWLDRLRHTTLGHLVLGHVFSWKNLIAYTAGIIAAVLIERYRKRRSLVGTPGKLSVRPGETACEDPNVFP